ncbi:MAG: hypothetical protein HY773_01030 [Candidatus Terrybacteria bacterium]|nr:hypothetical protein [Candidatus Terrybacteria bacterium]
MAQKEILTLEQKKILDLFSKEDYLIRKFYFTGGTPLSAFYLFFNKTNFLKVDFNYYPFPRIEKGMKYKNIIIDSIYDIAVNKVHTISMKARARDFIDVYFIIKEKGYTFEKLLIDAKAKFD